MEDNMFLKTAFIFPLEDGDDVDAFDAPYLIDKIGGSSRTTFQHLLSFLYIFSPVVIAFLISALRASE